MHNRARIRAFIHRERWAIVVGVASLVPPAAIFLAAYLDLNLRPFDHLLFHLPINESLHGIAYTREQMFVGLAWALAFLPAAVPVILVAQFAMRRLGRPISEVRQAMVVGAIVALFSLPLLDFARSMMLANQDERARLDVLQQLASDASRTGQVEVLIATGEQIEALIRRTSSGKPVEAFWATYRKARPGSI